MAKLEADRSFFKAFYPKLNETMYSEGKKTIPKMNSFKCRI